MQTVARSQRSAPQDRRPAATAKQQDHSKLFKNSKKMAIFFDPPFFWLRWAASPRILQRRRRLSLSLSLSLSPSLSTLSLTPPLALSLSLSLSLYIYIYILYTSFRIPLITGLRANSYTSSCLLPCCNGIGAQGTQFPNISI